MYLKLNNGVIEKYPYTIGDLRKDNPQTSFPSTIPTETLQAYEVFPVAEVEQPKYNYMTETLTEGSPSFDQTVGVWSQNWVVTSRTQEEIDQIVEAEWDNVRHDRNIKLSACDWTQLDDTPLSNMKKLEWANYRQALRDITSQPNPFEFVWPTQPSKE
jgi:hypothetical protein